MNLKIALVRSPKIGNDRQPWKALNIDKDILSSENLGAAY